MNILNFLIKFWREYPALFYGISFLLGCYGALKGSFLLLIPSLALWLPFLFSSIRGCRHSLKQLILSLFLMLSSWLYHSSYYRFPPLPPEGIKGTASLTIQSLSLHSTYFGKNWLYRCQLKDFFPDHDSSLSIASHLECLISIPERGHWQRPPANQDYIVVGTLTQTATGSYKLKIDKKHPWKAIKNSWSLAEKRYQAKQWVKTTLQQLMNHQKSASFLSGMATGEFEDPLIQEAFARFGLQHIMAISGFHFAILAAILNFLFRFIIPRKINALLIVIVLGFYFIFLGPTASILRSWIMISITMIGYLIDKPGKALNSLGIALIGVLGINPLLCQTLGFQFSFLVTISILLLGSVSDYYLTFLIPKRPLSEMVQMNNWNQHGYYLLSLFRQGLALTFAVNLFALPLTLYYFHQFPLMSLLYNLFFPLFISFSMLLLIIGCFCSLIFPPLGQLIHSFNSFYTKWILSLTYQMPASIDNYLKIEFIPSWLLITYICVLGIVSITIKCYLKEKKEEQLELAFI
jgi:competence protein ComEC